MLRKERKGKFPFNVMIFLGQWSLWIGICIWMSAYIAFWEGDKTHRQFVLLGRMKSGSGVCMLLDTTVVHTDMITYVCVSEHSQWTSPRHWPLGWYSRAFASHWCIVKPSARSVYVVLKSVLCVFFCPTRYAQRSAGQSLCLWVTGESREGQSLCLWVKSKEERVNHYVCELTAKKRDWGTTTVFISYRRKQRGTITIFAS